MSARELVNAALDRIERVNPQVNAVVHVSRDLAQSQAAEVDRLIASGERLGPLAGVPMTVKDMYEVAGMPSTSGTLGRARFVPDRDATIVERLRRAGAVVLGKTNVPEFGLAFESTNLVYGTTNNPYDVTRTAGGSSGGAAAALAAGLAALEVGSDGGGSIRLPAHFCGVAGFKPTHQRVSKAGHFPVHSGNGSLLAGYGPMARHVRDLGLAFAAMVGADPRDPDAMPQLLVEDPSLDRSIRGMRVAVHTDNGLRVPTPETVAAVRRAAAALEAAGAIVSEGRLPHLEQAFELHLSLLVIDCGLFPHWIEAAGTKELHPWVQAGWDWLEQTGSELTAKSASYLHDDWHQFRCEAARFMEDYDVLLGPVAPAPALPHGELSEAGNVDFSSYTSVHNLTGCPAVVVRAATSPEGLPIGVQLVAKRFRDDVALRAAAVVEDAVGGFVPPPMLA